MSQQGIGCNIARGDYIATYTKPMGKTLNNMEMGLCIAGRVAFWLTGIGIIAELGIMIACFRNYKFNATPLGTHHSNAAAVSTIAANLTERDGSAAAAAAVSTVADNLSFTATNYADSFEGLGYWTILNPIPSDQVPHNYNDGRPIRFSSEYAVINPIGHGYKYINAHEINLHDYTAIAAQYPVDGQTCGQKDGQEVAQVEPFLRMLFDRESSVVDLTNGGDISRIGNKKNYYPQKDGESLTFGSVKVTQLKSKPLKLNSGEEIGYKQTLKLTVGNESKVITRFHINNWDDMTGMPPDKLAQIVNLLKHEKLTIHCRMGLGRTFVLLAALMLEKNLEHLTSTTYKGFIDNAIKHYRLQRSPSVLQREPQLRSLYNYVEYRKNPALFD